MFKSLAFHKLTLDMLLSLTLSVRLSCVFCLLDTVRNLVVFIYQAFVNRDKNLNSYLWQISPLLTVAKPARQFGHAMQI